MNKVFFIGNLTKDPELSITKTDLSVCKFSIAVQRQFAAEGQPEADFFNCTAWRATADNVAKFCKKGNKVALTGSIQLRSYEDKDGIKRQAVEVVADQVEFLTPKSADGETKKSFRTKLVESDEDEEAPF